MTMTSSELINNMFSVQDSNYLKQMVESDIFVDIGVIDSVDTEGRGSIHSFRFSLNNNIRYEDVEIIYPGNRAGTMRFDPTGSACLIFVPQTCVPHVDSLKALTRVPAYSKTGIKAMPISSGLNTSLEQSTSSDGSIHWGGWGWSLDMNETGITLNSSETTVSIDTEGNLVTTNLKDAKNNITMQTLTQNEEGTILLVTTGNNTSGQAAFTTLTFGMDGSYSIEQIDKDKNKISTLSISKEGAAAVKFKGTLTLESEDTLTLKGKNVNITSTDSSGKVSINGTNLEVSS